MMRNLATSGNSRGQRLLGPGFAAHRAPIHYHRADVRGQQIGRTGSGHMKERIPGYGRIINRRPLTILAYQIGLLVGDGNEVGAGIGGQ